MNDIIVLSEINNLIYDTKIIIEFFLVSLY
jgi:hypothetical protein